MRAFHYKKVNIVVFIISLILILLSIVVTIIGNSKTGTHCINSIDIGELAKHMSTCLIAIANVLLLYATLNSQNRGIKNEKEAHERAQFETTFFNMVETFRKLIDEIKLDYIDLNGKQTRIRGRVFFVFALNEINKISDSLQSDKYYGKYDQYHADCSLQFLDQEYDNKRIDDEIAAMRWKNEKENEYLLIHSIQYTNSVYDILEKDFIESKSNGNLLSLSYKKFFQRFGFVYEHYLRFLKQILIFISNKQDSLYSDLINAQLSSKEIQVIKLQAKTYFDEDLKRI